MYFPINLTGGSYSHKSLPVSAQVTRNLWPQLVDDPITKNKYILESFCGQVLFGTAAGIGRGTVLFNNILYRVCGTTLYSVNASGVHTALGSIPGTERCIFDSITGYLVIVAERKAFIYDGSTLVENTSPNLESPDSCTGINNQIIFDGDQGRFGVTNVGDPFTINGLNYASAESKADDLVRVFAFNQVVYMLGQKTTEQWWNSGVGNPPFDRIEGGISEIGLAALHAVASNISAMYALGNDFRIYAINGSAKEVTTKALVREFTNYETVADAIFWCMDLNGQNFTVATFPTGDKTFVLTEGGQWFEWSSGVKGGRNVANSFVKAYGKNIVEDYRNGNLYYLDFDTYTENGATIIRQRDTAPLDGQLFGAAGKRVTMNEFVLNLECGVGLLSGQGKDPVVMLSYSDDGGKTFSSEKWGKIGKLGQFERRVKWTCLGSFYSRIIRIRTSDPVYISIRDAGAEIEVGI